MNSVEYYNVNAESFFNRTIKTDMEALYQKFLPFLVPNAKILDAGCGVGRDAKHFLNLGYNVTLFDASKEMVRISSEQTGKAALLLNFNDIDFISEFDAVWANFSLIHVPYKDTAAILFKIHTALKPDGIFYASYKYGDQKMEVVNRVFYNMNEVMIKEYIKDLFEIIEIWKSPDTTSKVAPSPSKARLNILMRKI